MPDWCETFLALLREQPHVSNAARGAGVSRDTAYRERANNPDFAVAWDDAIQGSVDDLEAEAFRRAKDTSDTLAIFLLKAHRKSVYGEAARSPLRGQLIVDLCADGDPAAPPGHAPTA